MAALNIIVVIELNCVYAVVGLVLVSSFTAKSQTNMTSLRCEPQPGNCIQNKMFLLKGKCESPKKLPRAEEGEEKVYLLYSGGTASFWL